MAVVTGHHHIRLYDTRAQRRPIQSIELGERPFTRCSVSPDDRVLITGDTTGRVTGVDLRTLRMMGVYKGATGSIRDIAIHATGKYLATVGLDRIMRVYDMATRQQLHRIYLRQRLNCVLFSSEEQVAVFAKEESERESDRESDGEEKESDGEERGSAIEESDVAVESDDSEDDISEEERVEEGSEA